MDHRGVRQLRFYGFDHMFHVERLTHFKRGDSWQDFQHWRYSHQIKSSVPNFQTIETIEWPIRLTLIILVDSNPHRTSKIYEGVQSVQPRFGCFSSSRLYQLHFVWILSFLGTHRAPYLAQPIWKGDHFSGLVSICWHQLRYLLMALIAMQTCIFQT